MDGKTYWFAEPGPVEKPVSPLAYLLPCYDEYIVGYTERSAISDGVQIDKLDSRGNVLFNNIIVLDGQVAGTWKRTIKKSTVEIELRFFSPPDETERYAVSLAAERYGAHLGLPVKLKTLS